VKKNANEEPSRDKEQKLKKRGREQENTTGRYGEKTGNAKKSSIWNE
jgi:hypothetical protein